MKNDIFNKLKLFLSIIQTSLEGRILLFGVMLTLLYIMGLVICWMVKPDIFQMLIGLTATHILFGRAAALSFGYTVGLNHGSVIPVSMVIETILVLIMYPLFVLTLQRLVEIEILSNVMRKINKVAEERHDTIRKFGIVGLFFFVWFPFWMTGPVLGSVIGFLLGLKVWVVLTVVLSGTYMAIVCWSILLRELHKRVAAYNPYVPMIMLAAIIAIVILGNILHKSNIKKK